MNILEIIGVVTSVIAAITSVVAAIVSVRTLKFTIQTSKGNVNRNIKSKEEQIREIEEQLFLLRKSPSQNMQQINYLKIELQKLQAEKLGEENEKTVFRYYDRCVGSDCFFRLRRRKKRNR